MFKFSIQALGAFAVVFGSVWLFNHVNAWVGIGVVVIAILLLIYKSEKSK